MALSTAAARTTVHAVLSEIADRRVLCVRSGLVTKLEADEQKEGLHLECLRTAVLGARKHCTPLNTVHCIAMVIPKSRQVIEGVQMTLIGRKCLWPGKEMMRNARPSNANTI